MALAIENTNEGCVISVQLQCKVSIMWFNCSEPLHYVSVPYINSFNAKKQYGAKYLENLE